MPSLGPDLAWGIDMGVARAFVGTGWAEALAHHKTPPLVPEACSSAAPHTLPTPRNTGPLQAVALPQLWGPHPRP